MRKIWYHICFFKQLVQTVGSNNWFTQSQKNLRRAVFSVSALIFFVTPVITLVAGKLIKVKLFLNGIEAM